MKGDACETLRHFEVIKDTSQFDFCQTVFNQAFKNGILSVMNEFTNQMTQNTFNSIEESALEDVLVKEYIKDDSHIDIIIGDYYLSETLFIFYDFLTKYYSIILDQQVSNLQVMIWVICIVLALSLGFIAYFSYRYLVSVYRHVVWGMSLIPFDKLANDEQIIFLIKQFWKEYN